jgi:hypothetical protein
MSNINSTTRTYRTTLADIRNIPVYDFRETELIAKIKEYGIPVKEKKLAKMSYTELFSIINEHENELHLLAIRGYDAAQREMDNNMIESTLADIDSCEYELIKEARCYGIPYYAVKSPTWEDWADLEETIESWKNLLKQAEINNVEWEINNYDPMGLEQAIDEQEGDKKGWLNSLRSSYYYLRGTQRA